MTIAPPRRPITFTGVDEIVEALRRADHRVSKPARAILDTLFAADGPVSAERIADGLGGERPATELTSVYRNLERLERVGVVSHVHLGHGPGLYALVSGDDPEYLVCEHCGTVETVTGEALTKVRTAIREAVGYVASFSHFPIHGVCAACTSAHGAAQGQDHPHVHADGSDHGHEHQPHQSPL